MCGIVGYIGVKKTKDILLDGLKELEYRGYDSAGIAVLEGNKANVFKAVGKLTNLETVAQNFETSGFSVGIGHTRWATHGKPTQANAHPHSGASTFVVHNGIIENYAEIKSKLIKEGIEFLSQTDTEVIAHLFEKNFSGDALTCLKKTQEELQGAYAVLLIRTSEPDKIYFMKKSSPPLMIGISENETYFASCESVLIGKAERALFLKDGEYGYATQNEIFLFANNHKVTPNLRTLEGAKIDAQKSGYKYFMEKEIYEQSAVLADAMMGRVRDGKIELEELGDLDAKSFNEVIICACGTSYHSALAASYLFERLAKIRCIVEIASEFRYKEPVLNKNSLFIVVSQSGETADTLEALKIAKMAGLKTLGICNVDHSAIVRESDNTILTRAGIEKGVASTKAFATQTLALWILSVWFGVKRDVLNDISAETTAMVNSTKATNIAPQMREKIHRLSKRYLHGHGFFFIGRDIFYPLALEGALKLKEISYLHAEGYPAGEMKHGPIALADAELFTIALAPKTTLFEKTKSNIEELSARDSTICAISPEFLEIADDHIITREWNHPMLEFFEMMTVVQILALEVSLRLGNDVDMPRNLAKSVTVE